MTKSEKMSHSMKSRQNAIPLSTPSLTVFFKSRVQNR